jgi:hypothetical protein
VVRHQPTSSNLGCPNSCPSFGLSVVDVSLRSGEVESSTDGRSGTRAATNEKRHTTNDKNHKATSPNKPSSTMVNKNLTFDPLPAEDIQLKVGTVAELNGIRYVTYYPKDQFICPWCGTTATTESAMTKHFTRCKDYLAAQPVAPARHTSQRRAQVAVAPKTVSKNKKEPEKQPKYAPQVSISMTIPVPVTD